MLDKKPIHKAVIDIAEDFMMMHQKIDVAIPFLCGAPGCGKTEIVKQMCKDNYWGLIDPIHFATKPLEKLTGIPKYKKKVTGFGTLWTTPEIIDKIEETTEKLLADKSRPQEALPIVVLFLDDLHLVDDYRAGYLFELFTERRFGDVKLPDNVVIVCAGNHADNKAGAKLENSAIMNRLNIMRIYPDFDFWKQYYAIANKLHPSVISFLNNNKYRSCFLEEELIDDAWSSPRSWTRAARKLEFKENLYKKKVNVDDVYYLFNGVVGKNSATNFTNYYSLYQNYDAKRILEHSKTFKLDDKEPLQRYIIINILVEFIFNIEKNIKETLEHMADILYVYIKEEPELASVFMKELKDYEKAKNKKTILTSIIMNINKKDSTMITKLQELLIDV